MMQTLSKTWWLLVVCGVLEAMYSVMNFFMVRPDGSLALRTFVNGRGAIVNMGMLALAAGACTVAAGIWSSRNGQSWLLVLNGLAFSALGLIFMFWRGPLAFRTIALLIVVMALSIGVYEFRIARTSRRGSEEWLLNMVGGVSMGFALAFLAFVFRLISLDSTAPAQSLHWLGSYFAFSAICMLVL